MGRTKKLRGNRTHGRGKKAGRGKGKRGGSGQAGLHKHKFKWMVKYDPDHFGRRGFKRPKALQARRSVMNLGEVEGDLESLVEAGHAKEMKGGGYEVDLMAAGVDKLLGGGNIKQSLRVIVPVATPKAVEKIKGAGGEVVLQAREG